jgi:hypothetical protein
MSSSQAETAVPYKVPLALSAVGEMQKIGAQTKAGATFSKAGGAAIRTPSDKLFVPPAEAGKALANFRRNEERVVIGGEQSGYINVQGSDGQGG